MCANNMTLSAALSIRDDREARANRHYRRLMTRARRYAIYGTDQQATDAAEQARKFAHIESSRGNFSPLLDQLQRALT